MKNELQKTAERMPGIRTIEEKMLEALAASLASVSGTHGAGGDIFESVSGPLQVGVAFSGGRDSMALLEAAVKLSRSRRWKGLIGGITALHVNHGLSPNADHWEEVCREFADSRGTAFEALSVSVQKKGKGVEAAAREVRYKALSLAAKTLELDVVLTAHHQDDRLETFLLQWMRGAGVDGLAGIPGVREFGEGGTLLLRPWLEIPRSWISAWAKAKELPWVDDESNEDTAYLRNLIRHEVLPVLDRARPGFRKAACRSVELVTEASNVLHSVAEDDMRRCRAHGRAALKISELGALPLERQALCLRAFILEAGLTPPPRATLTEALRQARTTHSDTALTIRIGASELRRYGSELMIRTFAKPVRDTSRNFDFRWSGEEEIPVPLWGGVFVFRRASDDEDGFPGEVLRAGVLSVRVRQGGEKLKLYPLRPSRNLKHLYQAAKVPSFDRSSLPLLWLDGQLIYAAGLGAEVRSLKHPDPKHPDPDRWVVEWCADGTLIS